MSGQRPDVIALLVEGADTQHAVALKWQEARDLLDRLQRIEAVADSENRCWVTRSSLHWCIDYVGGKFPNGGEWTEALCCLPCRLRAALRPKEAPPHPCTATAPTQHERTRT